MDEVTLIGIDLGKHVFHIHGQDAKGHAIFRKKLSRQQLLSFFSDLRAVTVVMEACAGSHWLARKLNAMGHVSKLISPQYVRPFVKSNKNDYIDAEAICEAASRPAMRFVEPRSEAQQLLAALHRTREGLVTERTATINRIHGILLEFGVVVPCPKQRCVVRLMQSRSMTFRLGFFKSSNACTNTISILTHKLSRPRRNWSRNFMRTRTPLDCSLSQGSAPSRQACSHRR